MASKGYLDMFLKTLHAADDFIVLDTETTGFQSTGEVVQIAILHSQGDVLLNTLVKPSISIPASARKVHGITDEKVKDAPTWHDVAPTVASIIQDKLLVVYNADFDRRILYNSNQFNAMNKTDWVKIPAKWLCAMNAFAVTYGEWNPKYRNYKFQPLGAAARWAKVDVKNAHSAIGDCRMALGVTQAMLAHYEKQRN